MSILERYPSLPYTLPFAAFVLFLAVHPYNPLPESLEYPVRTVALLAVLWVCSRGVISLHVSRPAGSILLGVAVFLVWVGPDLLLPGYRDHWIFQNPFTGFLGSSLSDAARAAHRLLSLRGLPQGGARRLLRRVLWGHRASLCLRTWPILGGGAARRHRLQLVDGPDQVARRLHPRSRRYQRLPLRIRRGYRQMGILALTGCCRTRKLNRE